ncbi:MAG TPA: hypothetical protein VF572_00380 [Candidatus Saccharimonadales bacterium]|jgi:hypothetical protein
MKHFKNTYTVVGYLFMAASLVAITLDETSMFATWLPIGAAFIAIGLNEKPKKK